MQNNASLSGTAELTPVLFVGPLPPPLHGFSAINDLMLRHLKSRAETLVFDRKPVIGKYRWLRRVKSILNAAALLARFVVAVGRYPGSMYIGMSGGKGQALDLLYVLLALATRHRIFIHHHSFAYLNRPTCLSKLCLGLLKRQQHITLCHCMATQLATAYNIPQHQIVILSNCAFLTTNLSNNPTPRRVALSEITHPRILPQRILRLGFLSNITAEKGIFDFFDVIESLGALSISTEAIIAGPVSDEIRDAFSARLAKLPNARHLGPVYGKEKSVFLQNIDMLLFPSRYVNEAEPVTLLEAMAEGVFIIAANRGCIKEMVPPASGVVIDISSYKEVATRLIAEWQPADAISRSQIQEAAALRRQLALSELEQLLEAIAPQS